jgi:hypothetical protein
MKILLAIMIASFLHLSCSNRQSERDFLYIKVISTGLADTFTVYNKGLGLNNYAYYDFGKDSLIYRYVIDVDLERDMNEYKTYVGHLADPQYLDTIRNLIQFLKGYGNGIIFDTIPDGDTYCGPEFYVEFEDSEGLHYNLFTLNGNDTLSQFSNFFYRLPTRPWQKKEVGNGMVRADNEIVHAMNRLGLYEKRQTPLIPQLCEEAIDLTKILGTWRKVESRYEDTTSYYTKITFGKNGAYTREEVENNKSKTRKQGRYILNSKDSTFVVITDTVTLKYKIEKLTDHCFEAMRMSGMDGTRLLRLRRLP